jgi:hypothetical protein
MRWRTLCILILTFEQINKQDRQCTYNIRLGHVHAKIVEYNVNKIIIETYIHLKHNTECVIHVMK